MPSKAQKKRGALLPAALPEDTVCIRFECPNDELIIAAAIGKIHNLGKWWSWERPAPPDTRNIQLTETFRQLLENTLQVGDCTVIDCETIQDCLDIQDPPPRETPPQYTEADLLGALDLSGFCNSDDRDKIFAFTTQLTDFINTALVDIFEKIEVLTNIFEVINEILDAVPLIGGLASLASDMIGFIQNTIAENYLAGFDIEERDYIRCGLFCLAVRNDCKLTIRDITQWLVDEIGAEIVGVTPDDFAEYFISIGIAAPKRVIVLSAFAMVMWAINWGSEVVGVGNAARFIKILASLQNDTDADWQFICDDCGFCIVWDFAQGNYSDDWQAKFELLTTATTANYLSGVGYVHQDVVENNGDNSNSRLVGLTSLLDFESAGGTVKSIEIEYYWIYGASSDSNAHVAISEDDVGLPAYTTNFGNKPPNGIVMKTIATDDDFSKLALAVRSSVQGAGTGAYSGSVTIHKITIKGTGNKPLHTGENC